MKKFLLKTKLLAILLAMNLFIAGTAFGQRFAVATGNWNGAIWATTAGGVAGSAATPTIADAVTINSGVTVTVNVTADCASLSFVQAATVNSTVNINTGITLTVAGVLAIPRPGASTNTMAVGAGILNAGSIDFSLNAGTTVRHRLTISTGTVTVTGSVIGSAGNTSPSIIFSGAGLLQLGGATTTAIFTAANGTLTTVAGSRVEYTAAGAQTIGNFTYIGTLILSGSGVKTTTGVTVNGTLSMEGTSTVSAAPTYGGAATLQYNTATARTAGAEWVNTFTGAAVVITNTGVITLNAAKVFNANDDLTINPGAGLNTSGTNFGLTFGGEFINNGIFTANASTITINGNATQNIGGFTSTGLVSVTKNGGTATFTGNVNADDLTMNTTGGGTTLNLGVGLTHTFTGTWTRTAGTVNGGSSTLNLSATPGPIAGAGGTFTAGTGTVEYSGAGVQTLAGLTYFNLTISGSGTKTLGANTTIANNGTLNLAGGTLAGGAFTLTMNSTSNITRSAGDMTVTPSGAGVYNVTYTGATKTEGTELAGTGLNNLTLNLTPAESLNLTASRTLLTVR